MRLPFVVLLAALTTPLSAQGEEGVLPFVDAKDAFARAAKEGKRVLVYQDWPT